jgi:hypothetical protein
VLLSRWLTRALVGVAVLGFLNPPATSGAAESLSWSLRPTAAPGEGQAARPFFTYTVSPGDEVSDSVTLYNPTDRSLHLKLFSSDAFNTRSGSFALNTSPRTNRDAGGWIKLPVLEFSVDPRTGVKIPFTVTVPRNASPGSHAAGIVALDTVPSTIKSEDGVAVQVKRAVGSRLYLSVRGPSHPGLDIAQLELHTSGSLLAPVTSGGTTSVEFTVANTGNTLQNPTVRVWLTDAFGRTVKQFPKVKLQDLLPGNEARLSRTWSGMARFPLRLTAHVAAVSESSEADASTSQIVIPWVFLLVVFVLGAAAVWLGRRRARRKAGAATAGAT